MELTADELAGVVDVAGPLTRAELRQAYAELAFKRGESVDEETATEAIESALATYHLVAVADHDAAAQAGLIVVGPVAFPELPTGATDLPHILDVPDRAPTESAIGTAAEQRFREEAAQAVRNGDDDRIETLLDVSYDLEAWGPVNLAEARTLLDEATHAN